jgi:hypothetical protein
MQNFNLKIMDESTYDVFVAGTGLAGIAAAIGAARDGLKVGMAEYFGRPGGVPVSGILGIVSGLRTEDELVSDGFFFRELLERARAVNGVVERPGRGMFEPEKLSLILLEMLAENGVELSLYTPLIGAEVEGRRIAAAITSSKSGNHRVRARLFVDATGDGDLAAMAGCPYEIGRESDGKVQSSSLTFCIGGIDADRVPPTPEITAIWRRYEHQVPTDHAVVNRLPHGHGAILNMTHILDCNCLNDADLLRIRREGTRQAFEIVDFFRARVPGFENACLSMTAEQVGVRETRRITGDYILTKDDVTAGRDFPDRIARCAWPIDIHNPEAPHSDGMIHLKQSYSIPYRCITPLGMDNLYMAGRPISADHVAFSSSRINGTCIALGQAIGLAASEAVKHGTRGVDVGGLQARLRAGGAVVDRTGIPAEQGKA